MHFYAFHLAEYAAHTRHLTPMEDLAYRRLLDAYYLAERAPQGTVEQVARSVGLRTELDAVASVLGEFFSSTPEGWINARCERELAAYRERREQAASAGRASGEKRRANVRSTSAQRPLNVRSTDAQLPFNGRSTGDEQTLNHKDKDKENYKDKDKAPEIQTARAPANPEPAPQSAPADAGAVCQPPPSGISLTTTKGPQGADRPEPVSRGRRKQIAHPEPVQAPLAKWGPLAGDPTPSVEEVIEAWAQAGLPRPTKPSVELVVDRAVRLKPGRDLAWCKRLFERVANSPWCRGEVHDHPRCQAWSLAHTLGNERRISQVLEGKYDPEPARERNKPASKPTQHATRFREISAAEAERLKAQQWTSPGGWDEVPNDEPSLIDDADLHLIALTGEVH